MGKTFREIDARARKKARRQQQIEQRADLRTKVHKRHNRPSRHFDWRAALEEAEEEMDEGHQVD